MSAFEPPAGKGAVGVIQGERISLGNASFLKELGVETAAFEGEADRLRQDGGTAIFVAAGGSVAGVIAIADPIKSATPEALAGLAREGGRIVMLTGDNRTTALAVARRLGIAQVEPEVLPQEKSAVVQRLRSQAHAVAMAGDGVNDAPALAAADVGIAMGTGTDVAMESAGVTLLQGDLTGIVRARRLSRATMGNIRQNLFLAFVYNAAGIPIAAGALYPLFGILLSPVIAAAAMSLSSVSVVANALRLRRVSLCAGNAGWARRARCCISGIFGAGAPLPTLQHYRLTNTAAGTFSSVAIASLGGRDSPSSRLRRLRQRRPESAGGRFKCAFGPAAFSRRVGKREVATSMDLGPQLRRNAQTSSASSPSARTGR